MNKTATYVSISVLIVGVISFFVFFKGDTKSPNPVASSVSTDTFVCPNDYKTVTDYLEGTAKWISTAKTQNPQMTDSELLELRNKEMASNNCAPSQWMPTEN